MKTKYFVDSDGKYLGAFTGSEPDGGVEVLTAPQSASQIWSNGWSELTLSDHDEKIKGVEFEGVMCSATAMDSSGLMEAREWVLAGNTTVFEFENGSELRLTPDNIGLFEATYKPFRASFFKV